MEEAKIRQELERAQKRLHDCETLITEAHRQMNRKKYKDALAKLEQARSLNVQEKDEEITSMIAEIEKLKEDNPFKRLLNALKKRSRRDDERLNIHRIKKRKNYV